MFAKHEITEGVTTTITGLLSAAQRDSLKAFLNSIDGRTDPLRSATDAFRDLLAGGP